MKLILYRGVDLSYNLRGSGSLRSSHQTRSRPKFVFVVDTKNGLLVIFVFVRFRPTMNFHFCFIFRFSSKNVICVGPKMFATEP